MTATHIAHDCVVGDDVIMINNAALTGHVLVEDRATVGGMSGLHPFTRMGFLGYIGGHSKVTQDVPPFVIADGVPAHGHSVNVIGMRRAGIDGAARRQVQDAFRILYRSGLAAGAAVARLRAEMGGTPLVARMARLRRELQARHRAARPRGIGGRGRSRRGDGLVRRNGEPRVRAGVVGAGHMGQYHILALIELWDIELVGIVDTDVKKAEEVAGTYGIARLLRPPGDRRAAWTWRRWPCPPTCTSRWRATSSRRASTSSSRSR